MSASPSPVATEAELADDFRRAWRGFATTVTLIATEEGGTPHAMLATAATTVSMEPPSLLICVNHSASAHDSLLRRGAFSLGLLGTGQHELGGHIARGKGAERFSRGEWGRISAPGQEIDGLPFLADAQATIFCKTAETHIFGTHTIIVATVEMVAQAGTIDPLLYLNGAYGHFSAMPG